MDDTKDKYMECVLSYFSKLYDSKYYGSVDLKLQNGMIAHLDRAVKHDKFPVFKRDT
jgi:hypothetical protein